MSRALLVAITVIATAPSLSAQAPVIGLRLGDTPARTVEVNETFDVYVLLDNSAPVNSVSAVATHDPTKLQLNSISVGDLSPAAPAGVAFKDQLIVTVDNDSGAGFIAYFLFNFSGTFSFPPGSGWQCFVANYTNLMTSSGDSTAIEFADFVLENPPTPPFPILVGVVPNMTLASSVIDLQDLTLTNFAPARFVRGRCSSSGSTLSVVDVLASLQYIFSGATAPTCLSACDANDDGQISFADSLVLLARLFGGAAPLPAPSDGQCGIDRTADDLGCEIPHPFCVP